ncbi:serine hydrolase domain-containing protein [Terracidiphilus gabretensis]|uniref:serine hydrolase domain-containing protein n=1 Tax=Terracidiphilus gabretensis TaxID=1577687 RepID=UPI00071B5BEC|nr:serine hydrolase domain-containing protein [Terracidiphilus gabretensis]
MPKLQLERLRDTLKALAWGTQHSYGIAASMHRRGSSRLAWLPVLIFLTLFSSRYGFGQQAALDEDFRILVENWQFNGGVLITQSGKVVYEKSFGYADFSDHRLNTPDVQFPIASISKLLTATGILQLAQAGKLHIDDPVTDYLPTFPYREIKLRHLLSHKSGLPSYNTYFDPLWHASQERVFTNADFLSVVSASHIPLLYAPGDKENYDNINYIVLALVLEKVSGEPYPDYIEKHILRPADMHDTKFIPLPLQYNEFDSKTFAYPHIYAHPYSDTPVRANTVPYIRQYWHSYAFSGFGDYVSTMRDLLKFDTAFRRGLLLGKLMQELAYTPIVPRLEPKKTDVFGLGWEIEPDSVLGHVVYHSGGATGLSCVLLRNLTRDQTVIVFDNTHSNAHEIASRALKILNGQAVAAPRKSAARLYVQTLLKDGPDAAHQLLPTLRNEAGTVELSEDEMNSMAYELMGANNYYHLPEDIHLDAAIDVLHTNTVLFPQSWNVWDSYGEALRKGNHIPESLDAYRRSLALKPDSEGAKKAITEMQETSKP